MSQISLALMDEKTNKSVDNIVAQLVMSGVAQINVDLTRDVFRAWALSLNKSQSRGEKPDDVMAAIPALLSNMLLEFIQRVAPNDDGSVAVHLASIAIQSTANGLAEDIKALYNLEPGPGAQGHPGTH